MPDATAPPRTGVPLDYGPAAPRRRRRRRVVVVLLILVALALGFWRGPTLWKRGWTAYVTHQACTFTAPADSIVYQDDSSTSRPLLQDDPSTSRTLLRLARTPAATTSRVPARTAPDPPIVSRFAAVVADPRGLTLFTRPSPVPEPLAFLHERHTPQGQRLLVALRITGLTYYASDGGTLACTYSAILFRPNGTQPPAQVSLVRAWGGVQIATPSGRVDTSDALTPDPAAPEDPGTIRVYFGAPDPADPSSFTVPYEVNGRRKHWRFRVSGNSVQLDEQ